VASRLIAPFVLQGFGPGSWWIVWWAMTLLASSLHSGAAGAVPAGSIRGGGVSQFRDRASADLSRAISCLAPIYIAYMTFMIAYARRRWRRVAERVGTDRPPRLRDAVGVARVLALDRGGLAATIISASTIGAALPIFGHSLWLLAVSALVFGVAFFAVVGSTTAFVRFNYPPSAWPTGIAAMTIAFGIGQTLGPIVVGAITDAIGTLSVALNVSAAMLVIGALLSAFQKRLRTASA
jgi:hypothetical protein